MAKVDEAEFELLNNLFMFIQKKYSTTLSVKEIAKKFGERSRDLVDQGEINEATLKAFCDQEGMSVPAKKSKPNSSSSGYSGYSGDSCGRSASRSAC